jgi:transposase
MAIESSGPRPEGTELPPRGRIAPVIEPSSELADRPQGITAIQPSRTGAEPGRAMEVAIGDDPKAPLSSEQSGILGLQDEHVVFEGTAAARKDQQEVHARVDDADAEQAGPTRVARDGSPIQEKWAATKTLLAEGHTVDEIAERLGVGKRAVSNYVEQLGIDALDKTLTDAGFAHPEEVPDEETRESMVSLLHEKLNQMRVPMRDLTTQIAAAKREGNFDRARELHRERAILRRQPEYKATYNALDRLYNDGSAVRVTNAVIPSRLRGSRDS